MVGNGSRENMESLQGTMEEGSFLVWQRRFQIPIPLGIVWPSASFLISLVLHLSSENEGDNRQSSGWVSGWLNE